VVTELLSFFQRKHKSLFTSGAQLADGVPKLGLKCEHESLKAAMNLWWRALMTWSMTCV